MASKEKEMAHPKKAGQEADRLIAEQSRLLAEQERVRAELAGKTIPSEAIETPAQPEVEQKADAGEPNQRTVEANQKLDVSNQQVQQSKAEPEFSEIKELKEQVRIANQRWNVLQGMINKKDEEIEQLRTLLAQLSQKSDSADQETKQHSNQSSVVTAQDIEDYGQDLVDLIIKVAKNTVANEVANINANIERQLKDIRGTVNTVRDATSRTAFDVFNENLTRRVPNWESLNVDPAFLEWLNVVDDFTGKKRIDLLNEAYSRMDLGRTARFFERFIEETSTQKPAKSTDSNVEKLISPKKSNASVPVSQSDRGGKIWTTDEIKKLYADYRAGKLSHDEFTRLERDLFKAQSDNRIAS